MTWNYRIVRHRDPEERFALYEVYYDDAGVPEAMSAEPITFEGDADEGPTGIVRSLEQALHDARTWPIFDAADLSRDGGPGVRLKGDPGK